MKNLILVAVGVVIAFGLLGVISNQSAQPANQNPPLTTDDVAPANPTSAVGSGELDTALFGQWWWDSTKMSDGTVTEPANPNVFSIKLGDDGSVLATTDCNSGRGSYTTTPPNQIAFSPMATTMMACENSQETVFLQQLGNTQSYFFTPEGKLVLEIKFDSGSMEFTKAE